jgi:hypothetical protein
VDASGNARVTVSNIGFQNSTEVFHPTHSGSMTMMGQIDERWGIHDIALVNLNPYVGYTNSTYFEAVPPKRLLRSPEIQEGHWYSAHSSQTGLVSFFCSSKGIYDLKTLHPHEAAEGLSKHTDGRLVIEYGYRSLEPYGWVGKALFGAPLVDEDEEVAGVAGFVRLGSGDFVSGVCLDELIDCGWTVA